MTVSLDDSVKEKLSGFCFAWAVYNGVQVLSACDRLAASLEQEQKDIKEKYTRDQVAQLPGVQKSRTAFKRLGLDPARYRPSQEALIRRTIADKPIRYVNTGVDINNLLSLRYIVPMGLYNMDQLSGPVQLRMGQNGELYQALNGRDIDCRQKIIISDVLGPFGSPYVDSMRTAVQVGHKELLHIIYFLHEKITFEDLDQIASFVLSFLCGQTTGYHLLSA